MTGHFKVLCAFSRTHYKFFASPTELFTILKVPGFSSNPTVLFTIKVTGHFKFFAAFSRTHYKFFASPTELFVIIKVPGFSSKSDGTFSQ